jgi:NAD(P)-dependent dehydrogenase (short-subunit alcohol dehydrogenase family)
MEPVGLFADTGFREWERSVQINFLRPLEVLHALLPKRGCRPTVLFFAGGGVNSAVVRYSGYTVSKIALMKMCELLDAEMPDVRFVIVGPGWVKTKIHAATLRAGEAAGDNLHKTQKRFAQDEWVSMGQVVACCTRLVTTSSDAVSGRNFSVKDDAWDSPILEETLERCPEMYKLRRCQNDWSPL